MGHLKKSLVNLNMSVIRKYRNDKLIVRFVKWATLGGDWSLMLQFKQKRVENYLEETPGKLIFLGWRSKGESRSN